MDQMTRLKQFGKRYFALVFVKLKKEKYIKRERIRAISRRMKNYSRIREKSRWKKVIMGSNWKKEKIQKHENFFRS